MEINIIKSVQSIANSFLDVFFWIVTKMGEEVFFLLVFAGIYLLFSKNFAYKYTIYYLISVGLNGVIKLMVRRPRPYVVSNEVLNRLPASEFSFPSGHTQGFFVQATTGMQEIGKSKTKKSVKTTILCALIFLGVMLMLSRLYWGQHYLSDTITGALIGISIPFIIDYVIFLCPKKIKEKITIDLICKCLVIACFAGFVACLVGELALGIASRKIYTFLAVYTSVSAGYLFDKKYIHYDEKSSLKSFFIKAVITYVVLVGLYFLCDLIFVIDGYVYYLVYLFLGLVMSIGLPYLFKFLFNKEESVKTDIQDNKGNKDNENTVAEEGQISQTATDKEEKVDGSSDN